MQDCNIVWGTFYYKLRVTRKKIMILKRTTNSKEVNTTPINLTNWKDQVRNATPQHHRGNILLQVRDDDHEKKDKWQTGKHNSHIYNETEGEKDVMKDGDILERSIFTATNHDPKLPRR